MAKKPKRIYYLIRRQHLNGHQVEAVLDMLRYDASLVECNAPEGFWLFSNVNGPDVARWKSFAIDVFAQGTPREAVVDIARRHNAPARTEDA